MSTATVNGHRCHYHVGGSGRSLLHLHGGFGGLGTLGDAIGSEPWRAALEQRCRVISFDRRSSGQSLGPPTEHSLSLFADDARALLDHLHVSSTIVWGVSAGCPIALTLALEHPEIVDALILSDGSPWFSRDELLVERLRGRIALLDEAGDEAAYEARRRDGTVGFQLYGSGPAAPDAADVVRAERREAVRHRLATLTAKERAEGYARELRTYSAYIGFDVSDRLADIRVPILTISGDSDEIFPGVDWHGGGGAPASMRNVVIAGGVHGSGHSAPAIEAIIEFVESLGSSRGEG